MENVNVTVGTVFCSLSVCVLDFENSKKLSFLQGAVETSRLTWRNLFGHRIIRSAFSGQIDPNALSQPWVDQKSNQVKVLPKQHFSCFYIKPASLRGFC